MLIKDLVNLTNQKLAGETLFYVQLEPFFDQVVDDINAELNACFPTFSEHRSLTNNAEQYDYFPDTYLRSVVAVGAAANFYTTDEEGVASATQYINEYRTNLFYMKRDYSDQVPTLYQAEYRGYLSVTDTESLTTDIINPDVRVYTNVGPQGATGAKGDPGAGIKELFIRDGKLYVTYLTSAGTDGPTVELGNVKGEQGEKGETGSTGARGEKGLPGAQGNQSYIAISHFIEVLTVNYETSQHPLYLGLPLLETSTGNLYIIDPIDNNVWKHVGTISPNTLVFIRTANMAQTFTPVVYMGPGVDPMFPIAYVHRSRSADQLVGQTVTVSEINQLAGAAYNLPNRIDLLGQSVEAHDEQLTQVSNTLTSKADLVDNKVPATQLPSFVDDVINIRIFPTLAAFETAWASSYQNPTVDNMITYAFITETKAYYHVISSESYVEEALESNKIYVDTLTNKTYRLTNIAFPDLIEISASLAIGETPSTAYRGDRGAIAYDHAQQTGNAHAMSLLDFGITVASGDINFLEGATAPIQEQINNHTHSSLQTDECIATLPEVTPDNIEMEIVDATVNENILGVISQVLTLTVAGDHVEGLTKLIHVEPALNEPPSEYLVSVKFPNESAWNTYMGKSVYDSSFRTISSVSLSNGNTVIVLHTPGAMTPYPASDASFTAADLIGGAVKVNGYIANAPRTLALTPETYTQGNLASLDATGNLVDSGKKAEDFVEANAPITGNSTQVWFPMWDTKGLVTGRGMQAFATTLKLNGVTKTNFIYTTSPFFPIEIDYSNKQEKPSNVTSGSDITLADNTEYRLTNVSTLTLTYPTGNFEVWMRITTAASGAITITLPATSTYIGDTPNFGNGETWEISIKDGVVVAGKVAAV